MVCNHLFESEASICDSTQYGNTLKHFAIKSLFIQDW